MRLDLAGFFRTRLRGRMASRQHQRVELDACRTHRFDRESSVEAGHYGAEDRQSGSVGLGRFAPGDKTLGVEEQARMPTSPEGRLEICSRSDLHARSGLWACFSFKQTNDLSRAAISSSNLAAAPCDSSRFCSRPMVSSASADCVASWHPKILTVPFSWCAVRYNAAPSCRATASRTCPSRAPDSARNVSMRSCRSSSSPSNRSKSSVSLMTSFAMSTCILFEIENPGFFGRPGLPNRRDRLDRKAEGRW